MPAKSTIRNPHAPIAARLRAATKPAMHQIAPHLYAPDPAADWVPEFTLSRFVEREPGKYALVPVLENFVRITADVLKQLGVGRQFNTLKRLGRAGFIELIPIAPHCYLLNLDSYYNHVRRCAEHPDGFWSPGAGNLEAYREAL